MAGPFSKFENYLELAGITATPSGDVEGMTHKIANFRMKAIKNFVRLLSGYGSMGGVGYQFSVPIPVEPRKGIYGKITGLVDMSGNMNATLAGFTVIGASGEVMTAPNLIDAYDLVKDKQVGEMA